VAVCHEAMEKLVACRRLLESHCIPVEIVSAGGTGDYAWVGRYPGVTEVQAGSYLVMDTDYRALCSDFQFALSVLATVISKTANERIVVDAGLKAISAERGLPVLKDMPGARLRKLSAEHGTIDILDPSLSVKVGDRIEIWV